MTPWRARKAARDDRGARDVRRVRGRRRPARAGRPQGARGARAPDRQLLHLRRRPLRRHRRAPRHALSNHNAASPVTPTKTFPDRARPTAYLPGSRAWRGRAMGGVQEHGASERASARAGSVRTSSPPRQSLLRVLRRRVYPTSPLPFPVPTARPSTPPTANRAPRYPDTRPIASPRPRNAAAPRAPSHDALGGGAQKPPPACQTRTAPSGGNGSGGGGKQALNGDRYRPAHNARGAPEAPPSCTPSAIAYRL